MCYNIHYFKAILAINKSQLLAIKIKNILNNISK